jgi:hypothetical protein
MTRDRFQEDRTRRLDALVRALEIENLDWQERWGPLRAELRERAGEPPSPEDRLALDEAFGLGSETAERPPAPAQMRPATVRA